AVQVRGQQTILADLWIVCANVGHALAVSRNCRSRINIAHQHLRGPAKHRHAVDVEDALAGIRGFAIENIIAIRRKCGTANVEGLRFENLSVAAGGYVAEPQTFFSVLIDHAYHVFPSGETAADVALPELVTCVTAKF